MFSATRPATVVSQARRFSTPETSVRLSRSQVSWTASSASLTEPSTRYATPRRCARCVTNSAASQSASAISSHSFRRNGLSRWRHPCGSGATANITQRGKRASGMEARMKNPAAVIPGAWQAVVELSKASDSGGVPADTMEIVHLRVSQVNGCSACVASAARSKQSAERLVTVAAWRESPYFTDAERAALALAEAATRLADSTDPVPDAIWDEAARHYDEQGMASLMLKIAVTNVFNRPNRVTRQPAGAW